MASISENWNVGISVDSHPAQLTSVHPLLSFLSLLENHIATTLATPKSQFTTAVISRHHVLSQYYQLKNNKTLRYDVGQVWVRLWYDPS